MIMKRIILISNSEKIAAWHKLLLRLFRSKKIEKAAAPEVIKLLKKEIAAFVFLNLTDVEEKENIISTIKSCGDDLSFNIIMLDKFTPYESLKSIVSLGWLFDMFSLTSANKIE